MWHTAKWEWHLHYKRIQAYHTHTYTHSVPSRWIVFTLAVERSTEPLVRDCSYFSLIAVSLSPPSLMSLIEHHSHMLRFHASSFTLTLFLSISVSFSFTYSPVIMPHPPLSLSSPLPVCFRLHISPSNWLLSVPAELHSPVFGKRTFRCGTLGIFHLAAHSFGRLSEGRPVLSWSFRNTSIIWFAAHQSPGVCCIAVRLLQCTRTALIVSVRSVGWRKPPQPVISQRRNTVEGQLRSVEGKAWQKEAKQREEWRAQQHRTG